MNKFLGDTEQLLRFTLLTCGLLTLAGAVVCLLWSNAIYAIACCIVSAWSIGYYLDTVWAQIAQVRRDQTESQTAEDSTQK